jgi:hypothetical protein
MKILSVSWNQELDKTKVHYTKEFLDSDWIVKLDVIKDTIYELQNFYDESFPKEKPVIAHILGHIKEEI